LVAFAELFFEAEAVVSGFTDVTAVGERSSNAVVICVADKRPSSATMTIPWIALMSFDATKSTSGADLLRGEWMRMENS
jgi:hypothetical protein